MTIRMTNERTTIDRLRRGATGGLAPVLAAIAGMAIAAPATAQDNENYEWEPGTGYHEEEWYDPSDWFDDDYGYTGTDYEETYGWWYDDDYYDYGDFDWDYHTDEDDPADYDYYDSPYDADYPYTAWDYYTDEDDPADYDYWDSPYDYDYQPRDRRQRGQQNQQRDRQRMTDDQRSMERAQLRGELEGWQRKSLQGQKDAHTLVRVRLDSGRSAIVNLGPNVELSRLNLEEGDTIAVRGVRGSIDGQDVLMARRVRVGDNTVRMNNWQPRQMRDRQMRDRQMGDHRMRDRQMGDRRMRDRQMRDRKMGERAGDRAQVRGQLDAWQKLQLDGQKDAHTVVRLRMDDGGSAIVNLGPNVELSRLNLEQGDRIAVRGVRGAIDGRDVLMAQYVRVMDTYRMNNWDPAGMRQSQRSEQGQQAGERQRQQRQTQRRGDSQDQGQSQNQSQSQSQRGERAQGE